MPFALQTTLVLAAVVTIGLGTDACAEQAIAPSGGEVVTPSEVLAAPGSFLDAQVRVRGRIHLVRHDTLGPCDPTTAGGCISAPPSLQLVTVGEPPSGTAALDLYRSGEQGAGEPLSCRTIGTNQFDCGAFTPDAITVVGGRIFKHRIPAQQVGTPAGGIQVIRYREIYVLIVRP